MDVDVDVEADGNVVASLGLDPVPEKISRVVVDLDLDPRSRLI